MKTNSLYVTRDDEMYETSGFDTYEEANAYREECQRSWINHTYYVFLEKRDSVGNFVKEINLTKVTKEERIKLLKEAGIPLK